MTFFELCRWCQSSNLLSRAGGSGSLVAKSDVEVQTGAMPRCEWMEDGDFPRHDLWL